LCGRCQKYTEGQGGVMGFHVHNLLCTKTFYTSNIPLKCFQCEQAFTLYKNFKVWPGLRDLQAEENFL
jgi:hypothetical protein